MKNINPAITTAEAAQVQFPRHQLILEDHIIRFSTKSSGLSNASLNLNAPLTIETLSETSNHAWALIRDNINSYIKYVRINQSSDWDLSLASTTQIPGGSTFCQRHGLYNNGTDVYLYYADVDTVGDTFQLKRVSLTSQTSNPISLTGVTTYGPTVPFIYDYANGNNDKSLNFLRNIKAVLPIASGAIVVTGYHNEGKAKIFLNFYYVKSSGYTKLATTLTGDISGQISEYRDAEIYSHACAREENGVIYVYFNTNESGRLAYFTIQNGIESDVNLVIPIDKEDSSQNFYCNSITKINNLYLMTGRLSFKNSDDTMLGFDTYLTSSDLKNWSIGETNSFIALSESRGKIVYSNNYLYYLGNLYWAKATPNSELAPLATSLISMNITSRVTQWSLSQTLGEADSFSFSINNQDLYFNSGNFANANLVYLKSGQGENLSLIGIYSLDSRSQGYAVEGIQLREVNGRDIAMKKLNDWQSPIDMWLEGEYQFCSDMKSSDSLIIKSEGVEQFGSFTSGSNFKFTGLNVPYMMLFDAPYSESSIIKASVYMTDYDDPYHLSSVGFMLGANEDMDKNFNSLIFIIPRERGGIAPYSAYPVLRKLNLNPIDTSDPEKINTGLKYEKFVSTLWRDSAADENVITVSTNATYEHLSHFKIPKNTNTDLMVRLNGRNIEFYAKPRVRSSSTWSENAEWNLKTVATVPDDENLYPDKNSYAGIVVSTDVSASKKWFAQGKYGDMVVQLSSAIEYGEWTRVVGTGSRFGYNESLSNIIADLDSSELAHLAVGMQIIWHGTQYNTGYYTAIITEILDSGIRINSNIPPSYYQQSTGAVWVPNQGSEGTGGGDYLYGTPGGITGSVSGGTWVNGEVTVTVWQYPIEIILLSQNPYFGEVSSQARATAINNSSSYVNIETGATKKAILLEGRGALVTSDSTAISIRHFDSDGVFHKLKSGNTGLGQTYTAFDPTSPLINTNKWKFIMYHGKFFDGTANSVGCKTNGYVIVEEEIIRYIQYSSLQRGCYPGDPQLYNTVTICPAAYLPVKDASLGTSYIYNWRSYGGALPGDQLDELDTIFGISPVGLLVEVISKNISDDTSDKSNSNYYIKSIIDRNTQGNETAGIELSTPLRTRLVGPITNIDKPDDPYWSIPANKNQAPEGDMIVVSGRAQFNTKKEKHSETAIVRYYPCNANGESPYIKINSTEYYNGNIITTEDIVKKIISFAGVRNIKARTSFDDAFAAGPLTYTLTDSLTTLPLQEDMADFTLDGSFYIPGNNINLGQISNRNELRIYFRNKYYIAIEQYVTAVDYDAGYSGTLYIRLATTDGTIDPYNSERTLESIKIRNKESFAGSYTGVSPVTNAILTPNLNIKTNIKISVNTKFISVEINNKKAISFCIDEYITDGGGSLAFYEPGPIQISYKSNIAGNTCAVTVQGVGDPMPGYALRKDTTARSAIGDILDKRHVFLRTTESGGVEFGQFWNRDFFGNLHTLLISDKEQYSKEQQVGHINYKSDKIVTNWIDEDWTIQNGYRYLSGSGVNVDNSYYALKEAKLTLRKQREESFTRDIDALPRLALQPEDEVNISHTNLPEGTYVINSVNLTAENSGSMKASYSVRKKVTI